MQGRLEGKVLKKGEYQEMEQNATELSTKDALAKVERAMREVKYGEIVVKMQNGKPIWVDKYERERVG